MAMLVPGRRISGPCVLSFSQAVQGGGGVEKEVKRQGSVCVFV